MEKLKKIIAIEIILIIPLLVFSVIRNNSFEKKKECIELGIKLKENYSNVKEAEYRFLENRCDIQLKD